MEQEAGEKVSPVTQNRPLPYRFLKVEEGGEGVLHLWIDRAKQLNTLSVPTLHELTSFFAFLPQMKHQVLLIRGAGGKAFAAGANIKELIPFGPWEAREFSALGQNIFFLMESAPQTIIAAIDGYCMGGGCDFAMGADIRVASERSVFAHTGAKMGIITGFGGTQRLHRLVGMRHAKEIFFTAERFSAHEALRKGFITQVIPTETFHQEVENLAQRIAKRPAKEMKRAKRLLCKAMDINRNAHRLLEYSNSGDRQWE